MIKVRWLRPHVLFAYSEGDICELQKDIAGDLLAGEYVELLPDNYQEPGPVNHTIPETDLISVTWLKPHPQWGYSEGDQGFVQKKHLTMLVEGDYVKRNGLTISELMQGIISKK